MVLLEEGSPDRILPDVESQGVKVIDLSKISRDYYRGDPHPNATWHRKIAKAIAGNGEIGAHL